MKSDEYIVFILSHGRADNVKTYKTLRKAGYTGRVCIVIDDEDEQGERYKENFGVENVAVFSKAKVAETFDEVIRGDRRSVVYARNACFEIAERLGYEYFIELDDDYMAFYFLFDEELNAAHPRVLIRHGLDAVFGAIFDFNKSVPAASVAMGQGGDLIGGEQGRYAKKVALYRKAMNSFFCSTRRPFRFVGRINEDVNAYTMEAHRGLLFISTMQAYLIPTMSQHNKGGMTDVYLASGTYVESFFSVICCPSAVSVRMMSGCRSKDNAKTNGWRMHHCVDWDRCAPKIISERYRRTTPSPQPTAL